jgi:hypothetical protein
MPSARGATLLSLTLCVLALMVATRTTLSRSASAAAQGARQSATRLREYQDKRREVARAAENRKRAAAPVATGPIIVLREDAALKPAPRAKRQAPQEPLPLPFVPDSEYLRPSLTLLDAAEHGVMRVDEEALRKSSEVLETKLANLESKGRWSPCVRSR